MKTQSRLSDNKINIITMYDSSVLIEAVCVINVIRNKLLFLQFNFQKIV